jgi:hypothetical protein
MTAEQVRTAREASPFIPFTLYLTDGRSFHIHHRDYISLPPGAGRIAMIYHQVESASLIDLYLVTELRFDVPKPVPEMLPSA